MKKLIVKLTLLLTITSFFYSAQANIFGPNFSACYHENNAKACSDLAWYMVNNKRGDIGKITELFIKSCNLGYMDGCTSIALMYKINFNNIDKAVHYAEKACNNNEASGCATLGDFYRLDAKIRNKEKSIFYYKKSCDLKHKNGCAFLEKYKDTPY